MGHFKNKAGLFVVTIFFLIGCAGGPRYQIIRHEPKMISRLQGGDGKAKLILGADNLLCDVLADGTYTGEGQGIFLDPYVHYDEATRETSAPSFLIHHHTDNVGLGFKPVDEIRLTAGAGAPIILKSSTVHGEEESSILEDLALLSTVGNPKKGAEYKPTPPTYSEYALASCTWEDFHRLADSGVSQVRVVGGQRYKVYFQEDMKSKRFSRNLRVFLDTLAANSLVPGAFHPAMETGAATDTAR